MRIFAGPNGSGKTTLFDSIKSSYFSTRIFINADLLEEDFKRKNFINLSDFEINITNTDFESFCFQSGLFVKAGFNAASWNLVVKENVIVRNTLAQVIYNSYHFAIIADFIRYSLIKSKKSFSFETVFSHPSKLDLIDFAHQNNYKIYLYFIGTETPKMNVERVKDRVLKGGHLVNQDKIEKRYFLTMDLLIEMIKNVDKTYLWDNSETQDYVGQICDGTLDLQLSNIPNWIDKYILDKIKK
ncbi:toxin [Pedobacter terrae]|uniref:toxin n=1 Tax=Pedobacter terrae TaxID=405671 RepID=UPI00115FAB83|nr:toxin [Pedobacter terrae]